MLNKEDELKIEQIYNKYGLFLLNTAYSVTGNRHNAEEVVQETVVKILRHPNKISDLEGEELKNYVKKIVVHTGIDFTQKLKKENYETIPLDSLIQQDIPDDFDLDDFVINKATKDLLKSEINKLKASYRDPLIFHKLYGYSISEISELLDTPERTVSYRIKAALKILRKNISKRTDFYE